MLNFLNAEFWWPTVSHESNETTSHDIIKYCCFELKRLYNQLLVSIPNAFINICSYMFYLSSSNMITGF